MQMQTCLDTISDKADKTGEGKTRTFPMISI